MPTEIILRKQSLYGGMLRCLRPELEALTPRVCCSTVDRESWHFIKFSQRGCSRMHRACHRLVHWTGKQLVAAMGEEKVET